MLLKSKLKLIAVGLSIFGFSLFGATNIAKLIYQSENDYQNTAYCKWGSAPVTSEEWFDEKAEYDLVAFSYSAFENPRMENAQNELRKRNIDILLGTYVPGFTVSQWCKIAYENGQDSYLADWWEQLSPNLAYTTEQDTAALFLNNYVYDLFNPEARTRAITMVDSYIREYDLDWVMIDFITVPLPNLKQFQDPIYEEMELGDLDFDRDGIGHWDDKDEQDQLRIIWDEYIKEMRITFPQGTRIIPNGRLAIKDPEFSKLVDGCYIENFPNWFFGTVDPNFNYAISPLYPNSLYNLENRKWFSETKIILIEDIYNRMNYGVIASLFDNVYELKRMKGETTDVPNPVKLGFGRAMGPAVLKGGAAIRDFENTTLYLDYSDPSRIEYDF